MIARHQDQFPEELLAQLTLRGDIRTFQRGEMVCQEGETSDLLYILVAGELKVFTLENDRELVYNLLRPGELFGELILDGGPRTASVKAVCTSMCVVLSSDTLRGFLRNYPEFAEFLVQKLISRVRHATEQLRDMAMKDVYQRATNLLNELAVDKGDGRAIDKAITQQEIANRIGATREMVNHIIRDLVRGGFLVRDGERGMILIKDLPKHW